VMQAARARQGLGMRRTLTPIAGAGRCSMALPISCWVMRLVEPEVTAAWQPNGREQTPSFVADGAARDPFPSETDHLCSQVVAHEIELMPSIALGGMTGELRGRRSKDQPSTAGIDGGKAKHIFEKGPIGLGVACLDHGMHACNHGHLHRSSFHEDAGKRVPVVKHRNNASG